MLDNRTKGQAKDNATFQCQHFDCVREHNFDSNSWKEDDFQLVIFSLRKRNIPYKINLFKTTYAASNY